MERASKADLSILVRKPNLTFDNVDLSILKDQEPRNFKSPFVDTLAEVPVGDVGPSKTVELPVLLKPKPSTKGKERERGRGILLLNRLVIQPTPGPDQWKVRPGQVSRDVTSTDAGAQSFATQSRFFVMDVGSLIIRLVMS
jgi:hypothetical protein